jgi:hypothetical protein
MDSVRAAVVLIILLLPVGLSSQKASNDVTTYDNSDWWSIIRSDANEAGLKPEKKDIQESNFQLLGVTVGTDDLDAIQAKLGKAAVVTRGDASTGRSQICYRSEDGNNHLAFEGGEVEYTFYLFTGGPDWTGSDLCVKSKFVTSGLGTVSGLQLEKSPAQVKAILGEPTKSLPNGDLIYFRQIRKRWAPTELKRIREHSPDASDDYYMTAYIEARFSDSKLIYLGVLKSITRLTIRVDGLGVLKGARQMKGNHCNQIF